MLTRQNNASFSKKNSKMMTISLPQEIQEIQKEVPKKLPPTLSRNISETRLREEKKEPQPPKIQMKKQQAKKVKEQPPGMDVNAKNNQQALEQIRKWKQLNQSLKKKREQEYELFKKKLQLEREKSEQERMRKLQADKSAKKERIKKKMQELEQRKQKREQQLSKSKVKQHQNEEKEPLFQVKQKEFMMKQIEQQTKIRENILRKKQQLMIDMDELRRHEEKFLNHLKEREKKKKKRRNKSKSPTEANEDSRQKSERQYRSEFNKYINKDPQRKQKELQKYLRRKKFQERVKRIPITIDQQKVKQALIAKDKAKNPFKYNYLSSVAALNDQKIYEQFKDFEININLKEVGNDYMRQIHSKIPIENKLRSQSQSQLKPIQKKQYKNYIPEVSSLLKKKRSFSHMPNDEVQQVLYRYESNSDRLAVLNQKSQRYKNQAMRKIMQIKSINPNNGAYTDYLGKEQLIDDLYMKSIKMKLASALIAN